MNLIFKWIMETFDLVVFIWQIPFTVLGWCMYFIVGAPYEAFFAGWYSAKRG